MASPASFAFISPPRTLKPFLQVHGPRSQHLPLRDVDEFAIETFHAMLDRRVVVYFQQCFGDHDRTVRSDAEEVRVEGSVLEATEGEAVRDLGLSMFEDLKYL